VFGVERLIKKIKGKHKQIRRVRSVGVKRAGRYLYEEKREKCKQGLYSGQEVAPNKWRYGWSHLGGPADYHFTKNLLNAHKLGAAVIGSPDRIEVSLDLQKAPYGGLIHGPMRGKTMFYNPRMKMLVESRPWMKIQKGEAKETVRILIRTYRGG